MRLLVLTPESMLLEADQVGKVRIPLADGGSIGIHPGHHPLLAETVSGRIEYGVEEYSEIILVREGILRVEPDQVTIYTSGLAGEADQKPKKELNENPKTLEDLQQLLEGED